MKKRTLLVRAGLTAAVLSFPHLASAANASWTGGGTDGDFGNGANWSTGAAPGNTSGSYNPDTATFNSSINTIVSIGQPRYVAAVNFDTGAGAFTFKDGTIYTRYFTMSAGVTQSQTIFGTISGWAFNPDLILTNSSTTQGVIFNFRGALQGGTNAGGPVKIGAGAGTGTILWGSINDVSVSKATSVQALDNSAQILMLRGNNSTFTGGVSFNKGAVYFDSVSNVGGGASSFGAQTTAANATINIAGASTGRPVYMSYTGSGATTDRVINNATGNGTGLDLANVGTGALVWNGNFTNNSTVATTVALGGFNKDENRYGGVIADAPTVLTSLTKYGQGTWNLSAANTYLGTTTVSDGLLRADFAAAGAPTSDIINSSSGLTMNGGTFGVRGAALGTSSQTVGGLTLNRGSSTVSVDGNGGDGTTLNLNMINRAQTGSTLNVQTSSTGVVSASGVPTTNDVLSSASTGGVAYATVNGSDWATIDGGNIVALTAYQTDVNPANWVATDNVSLSGNPSAEIATQTINTLKVSGAANVAIQASKTLTLGAGGLLFTGSGAQSISGGSITSGTAVKELIVHQNNIGSAVDISSTITGAGLVLTKTGAGTLNLSGTNNYTGGTIIAEGVLKGNITSQNVTLSGGVWGLTSDVSGNLSSRVSWTNSGGFAAYGGNRTVTLNSGATINWNAGGFVNGGQALIFGAADADSTLNWTNAILLNTSGSGNAVSRELRIVKGKGTAAVDAEMSGVLSGYKAGILKTGDGTLRLTAANTYDGPTIISAGTLIVNGSINNSMLTMVYSGATLAGTGSSAQIELMAGGSMSPGDGGIGTFSTAQSGNSDFNWHGQANGTFAQMKFELSNADATSDRLALGNGMLIKVDGSVFKFDFLNTGMADTTYTLMTFGSSMNFAASDFSYTNLAAGLTGNFTLTNNSLLFTTAAVPEPSQVILIVAGLGVLMVFRRRLGRHSA